MSSSQTQGRSRTNYQNPAPPKKKNESIHEDGARSPLSHAQKQWRQTRQEEDSGQHFAQERAKENHGAKIRLPWRKKKKAPTQYHDAHHVRSEGCGHHDHGGHDLALQNHGLAQLQHYHVWAPSDEEEVEGKDAKNGCQGRETKGSTYSTIQGQTRKHAEAQ